MSSNPGGSQKLWFIKKDGESKGPYKLENLKKLLADGLIDESLMVCPKDEPLKWRSLESVLEEADGPSRSDMFAAPKRPIKHQEEDETYTEITRNDITQNEDPVDDLFGAFQHAKEKEVTKTNLARENMRKAAEETENSNVFDNLPAHSSKFKIYGAVASIIGAIAFGASFFGSDDGSRAPSSTVETKPAEVKRTSPTSVTRPSNSSRLTPMRSAPRPSYRRVTPMRLTPMPISNPRTVRNNSINRANDRNRDKDKDKKDDWPDFIPKDEKDFADFEDRDPEEDSKDDEDEDPEVLAEYGDDFVVEGDDDRDYPEDEYEDDY